MRTLALCICMVSLSTPVRAEMRVQLPTETGRRIADVASWGTLAAAIAVDTVECDRRLSCFLAEAGRLGIVAAATSITKHQIHRDRPCAPVCGLEDSGASFFSGHTAVAFSAVRRRPWIVVPLAIATGVLRVSAGKHWMTDVAAGAFVGTMTSRAFH